MPLLNGELTDNDRFYKFRLDYPELILKKAVLSGRITQADSDLIVAFVSERQVTGNIGSKRCVKWVSSLVNIRRFLGPYTQNTIADIYSGVNNLNNGRSVKGKNYSVSTKIDYILALKSFYFWLIENEHVDIPEKKIKAIKVPRSSPTKKAADMLTPEEITSIIEACLSSRDRAIFMTLYEGGFRVGEIGEMRWGNLKFDGTGVIVHVKFKTQTPRYVRLVMAMEHLIKWKSDYPHEITDDSLVFVNENGKPLIYQTLAKQLCRVAKRAGVTKHVTPHLFRHSRTTHLIQQGVSESVIKMICWGSISTQMFKHYAHLSGVDVDREIFNLYGIDPMTTQVKDGKLEPKVCPHCKEINSPVSHYCHICSHPLDEATLIGADAIQEYLINNADLIVDFLNERKQALGTAHSDIV